jgi:hypothetical protein
MIPIAKGAKFSEDQRACEKKIKADARYIKFLTHAWDFTCSFV